jgi:hypothetical protein
MARWDAVPRPIRLYLEAEGIATKRLAYLLVDWRGVVTDWGGDVAMLAPRNIEIGLPAAKQLIGLVGLLPASEKPVEIPHFQVEPGIVVHLHVLATPDGDAVVMVDAAPDHERKRKRQQLRNEKKLASRSKRDDSSR